VLHHDKTFIFDKIMNRIVQSLIFVFLIGGYSAYAQKPQTKVKASAPKRILMPQAYLGNSDYKGGVIPKAELSKLLKQGLTSRDSLGNRYKVAGFEFAYSERMIYEDSLGTLFSTFDMLSEYCIGDTLSAGIAGSIYDRFKIGDTVYINRVKVIKPMGTGDGMEIAGRGMKCVIAK
jgi:hypothetical protein